MTETIRCRGRVPCEDGDVGALRAASAVDQSVPVGPQQRPPRAAAADRRRASAGRRGACCGRRAAGPRIDGFESPSVRERSSVDFARFGRLAPRSRRTIAFSCGRCARVDEPVVVEARAPELGATPRLAERVLGAGARRVGDVARAHEVAARAPGAPDEPGPEIATASAPRAGTRPTLVQVLGGEDPDRAAGDHRDPAVAERRVVARQRGCRGRRGGEAGAVGPLEGELARRPARGRQRASTRCARRRRARRRPAPRRRRAARGRRRSESRGRSRASAIVSVIRIPGVAVGDRRDERDRQRPARSRRRARPRSRPRGRRARRRSRRGRRRRR